MDLTGEVSERRFELTGGRKSYNQVLILIIIIPGGGGPYNV